MRVAGSGVSRPPLAMDISVGFRQAAARHRWTMTRLRGLPLRPAAEAADRERADALRLLPRSWSPVVIEHERAHIAGRHHLWRWRLREAFVWRSAYCAAAGAQARRRRLAGDGRGRPARRCRHPRQACPLHHREARGQAPPCPRRFSPMSDWRAVVQDAGRWRSASIRNCAGVAVVVAYRRFALLPGCAPGRVWPALAVPEGP